MLSKISCRLSLVSFVFIALLAGCRKKDIPQKTRTELLTAATWKFSQAGLDTNNDGTIDTTLRPDLLPLCSTDNMFTFNADSSAILDENVFKCNAANPQFSPFKWYFLNNETEFFMSIRILPVYEGTSKIVELTDKRFVITRQVGIHGFPSYLTFVIVLVH